MIHEHWLHLFGLLSCKCKSSQLITSQETFQRCSKFFVPIMALFDAGQVRNDRKQGEKHAAKGHTSDSNRGYGGKITAPVHRVHA